jgi:hypothetical protein
MKGDVSVAEVRQALLELSVDLLKTPFQKQPCSATLVDYCAA